MYYTEREVKEMLDKAFQEGYDDGIDDTIEYIDENYEIEDDSFDLMNEYESYTESKNVRNQMDRLNSSADPYRKAIYAANLQKNQDWIDKATHRDDGERKHWHNGTSKGKGSITYADNVRGTGYIVDAQRRRDYADFHFKKTSNPRGRIKVAAPDDTDPRSYRLREKVLDNRDLVRERKNK